MLTGLAHDWPTIVVLLTGASRVRCGRMFAAQIGVQTAGRTPASKRSVRRVRFAHLVVVAGVLAPASILPVPLDRVFPVASYPSLARFLPCVQAVPVVRTANTCCELYCTPVGTVYGGCAESPPDFALSDFLYARLSQTSRLPGCEGSQSEHRCPKTWERLIWSRSSYHLQD